MMILSALLILNVLSLSYAGYSSDEKKQCVEVHNKLRALHQNTGALVWDTGIAAKAQAYAEVLARSGRGLVHDTDETYGENLYWNDNVVKAPCAKAVLNWYNEINDYSYGTAESRNGKAVGHFTQVIWKATTRFGVGIATRQIGKKIYSYVVAKYDPKGNFYTTGYKYRDYTKNVKPRKSGTVTPSLYDFIPCADSAGTNCQYYSMPCTSDTMKDFCAKKCRVCKAEGTTSTGTTSTGTTSTGTTSTGTTSTGKTCNDKARNCVTLTGFLNCNGSMKNYLTNNCAKTCGVCTGTGTTTTGKSCNDESGTKQCRRWILTEGYPCGASYTEFFTEHCAKTCNYC